MIWSCAIAWERGRGPKSRRRLTLTRMLLDISICSGVQRPRLELLQIRWPPCSDLWLTSLTSTYQLIKDSVAIQSEGKAMPDKHSGRNLNSYNIQTSE